jgi:Transglutaminase-like superfamily
MMPQAFQTLLALPMERRRLLAEALISIVTLRAGLRLLPFTTVRRWTRRWTATKSGAIDRPGDVVWAVDAIGSRIPGTTCLVEALTADWMLRRRGYTPALQIGVRHGAVMSIDAHAWVEYAGTVVIGTMPELTEYAVLSSEPPASRFDGCE